MTVIAQHRSTALRIGDPSQVTQWVKYISLALIIGGLIALGLVLPMDRAADALTQWVKGAGPWGPIVFGAVYVLAVLLFVPGWTLTVAAGAAFGLLWGTVTTSIASTIAAALAFLIARYLARGVVEQKARRYPKFAAIDHAIGKGGWKVVALARLSPAVPFSAGNCLFGLTQVGFWSYILTSWLAMLPGTFLYVYIGYLGLQSLTAADEESQGVSIWRWVLLGIGLIATIIVTIYIHRMARRMMASYSPELTKSAPRRDVTTSQKRAPASWTIIAAPVAAILVSSLAVYAYLKRDALSSLFGPPQVTLNEAYHQKEGGPRFDHGLFDELVKAHVDADGWVDYKALSAPENAGRVDQYITAISKAPFDEMDRDEKLALLINAYNAFTVRLILDHYPLKSIKDIPADQRWDGRKWKIEAHAWTLNEIEHEQIRPKFKEPRIHFALNCAAIGCPTLRNEAYQASRLEEQLEAQAKYIHTHDRWFQFDPPQNIARLTQVYDWYGGDFKQVAGSPLKFAARYSPELKKALDAGKEPKIQWLDYDWTLNDSANKGNGR